MSRLPQPSPRDAAPAAPDLDPLARLRHRVEAVGDALRAFIELHAAVATAADDFDEVPGPKRLALHLGEPIPMASRLLRALSAEDAVERVLRMPGPDPLRRWARAARRRGASAEVVRSAVGAADEFEQLIVDEAGDRARLDALLARWVPGVRRPHELRRRQAVFRGLSELKGVSCDLELNAIVLHPSEEPGRIDLCCVQARTGLVSLRPGLKAHFVTERLEPGAHERSPTCLDGRPSLTGLDGLRLDDFCPTTPARMHAERLAGRIQYSLEVEVCGPRHPAGIVLAEVDRGEFERRPAAARAPFFFFVTRLPTRRAILDLHLHADLVPSGVPELAFYEAIGDGPARPGDPLRELDRLDSFEEVEVQRGSLRRRVAQGLPRYGELLEHVTERLGWTGGIERTLRVEMEFPVPGTQAALVLRGAPFGSR